MKKIILFVFLLGILSSLSAQTIREYSYNVYNGDLSSWYNRPGNIIYPNSYYNDTYRTPVVFVHGITGKVSNSYKANIDQVKNYHLKAAFVQLNPLGTPEQNGKLLKRMIDRITAHYGSATVSIIAHSKGGMDTERALYGRNPYNNSIPSFGYEKVDGVYTFSSPLRGARIADVGAILSWTGVAFIAMWYTNGYQLTSGSVNSFHNWAKGWRINSYTTFKNYYNPNGASYSRINMTEDNTTRWWAHQSDDACYQNIWYFCYVGNAFHHTAGAYYDAYWEWDWFDSGWRNWHSSNDGFISEYRAKRSIITNASNALTQGAGDSNWRVMHNANHTSLWEPGENHFSREVAPYLHRGFYGSNGYNRPSQTTPHLNKNSVDSENLSKIVMLSKGNIYYSKNGQTNFIIEENKQSVNLIIYSDTQINQLKLSDEQKNNNYNFTIIDSKIDKFTGAYQSIVHIDNLDKGVYKLNLPATDFIVMAEYETSKTAFGVNFNFDETEGYDGQQIEVAIANQDNSIDFSKVNVTAKVNLISNDGDNPVDIEKQSIIDFRMQAVANKPGHYITTLQGLIPGAVYGIRIEAKAEEGNSLLSRNVLNTFFVKDEIPVQNVNVTEASMKLNILTNDMISIYPNPAKELFTVSIDDIQDAKIDIYNQAGQLVKQTTQTGINTKINIKDLSSGMYFVKVRNGDTVIVKSLLVK